MALSGFQPGANATLSAIDSLIMTNEDDNDRSSSGKFGSLRSKYQISFMIGERFTEHLLSLLVCSLCLVENKNASIALPMGVTSTAQEVMGFYELISGRRGNKPSVCAAISRTRPRRGVSALSPV